MHDGDLVDFSEGQLLHEQSMGYMSAARTINSCDVAFKTSIGGTTTRCEQPDRDDTRGLAGAATVTPDRHPYRSSRQSLSALLRTIQKAYGLPPVGLARPMNPPDLDGSGTIHIGGCQAAPMPSAFHLRPWPTRRHHATFDRILTSKVQPDGSCRLLPTGHSADAARVRRARKSQIRESGGTLYGRQVADMREPRRPPRKAHHRLPAPGGKHRLHSDVSRAPSATASGDRRRVGTADWTVAAKRSTTLLSAGPEGCGTGRKP